VSGDAFDVAVIGGGLLGAAVAFGLARPGHRVAVLDEGDRALRAARANFGLVWVQTKGDGLPPYMEWTLRSAKAWPGFARDLRSLTGVDVHYRNDGGLVYCVGEVEFEAKRRQLAQRRRQTELFGTELLERPALERLLPGVRLGTGVSGASYCAHDGDCNPLMLLRALLAGLERAGAKYLPATPVRSIAHRGGCFAIDTPAGVVEAGKVVLAAGHGNTRLAPALGLPAPIRAERGQILVTERMRAFLPLPASGIRQTDDGTVLIGASKESTGYDDGTTVAEGARMGARALQILPELARVRVVRTWGGIRVLTPDHGPVYAQSESCPGAFVAICHSGVTLAAVHATELARSIQAGGLADPFQAFDSKRFDVPKAA
jgi:glycine/D-amino acid oxidase-like deaminating enzyme